MMEKARCVRQQIKHADTRPKTRAYLQRLWGFLEGFANPDLDRDSDGLDTLPSSRRLAELLDIPRARVPELLQSLGGQVQTCTREAGSPGGPYIAAERTRLKPQNQKFAQLQKTLEEDAAEESSRSPETVPVPHFGDIVAFESSSEGVFWRAGKVYSEGRQFTAVDRFPFVGPIDTVLVAPDKTADPEDSWVVRLEVELMLPGALPPWRVVTRLPPSNDQPDQDDMSREEGLQRVAADWMEYADWMERGPRRAYCANVRETLNPR